MPEIVMPLNGSRGIHNKASEKLHPNNCIDEEQNPHQHANIGKGLKLCNQIKQSYKKCTERLQH